MCSKYQIENVCLRYLFGQVSQNNWLPVRSARKENEQNFQWPETRKIGLYRRISRQSINILMPLYIRAKREKNFATKHQNKFVHPRWKWGSGPHPVTISLFLPRKWTITELFKKSQLLTTNLTQCVTVCSPELAAQRKTSCFLDLGIAFKVCQLLRHGSTVKLNRGTRDRLLSTNDTRSSMHKVCPTQLAALQAKIWELTSELQEKVQISFR